MTTNFSRPISTVAALIQNTAGEILFLKSPKWSGKWALPAGKVEFGETLIEAMKREALEETGLSLNSLTSLLVQELRSPEDFHTPAHFISHAFLAECDTTNVIRNEESTESAWQTPSSALELDLNTPTRELLEHPLVRKILQKGPPENQEISKGKVVIDSLEFECIIGILPEERDNTQPLRLSVTLETCFRKARESEDVANTVDYFKLAERAKAMIVANKYQLIETLVEDVAADCLKDPKVASVTIRAEKPQAVPGARCSAVEVTRKRS